MIRLAKAFFGFATPLGGAPLGMVLAAALVVLSALGGLTYIGHEYGERHEAARLQPVITQLNTDLAQCVLKRDEYKATVDQQEADVQALARQSEAAKAEADRRVQAALGLVKQAQKEVRRVYARKPDHADQCVAAQTLILDELRKERQ